MVAAKIGKMEHELDTNAKHLEKIEKELENNKQGMMLARTMLCPHPCTLHG